MTDTTTDASQEPTDASQATQEQPDVAEDQETPEAPQDDTQEPGDDKGGKGEAKLRKRAQAAEQERDALTAQVETLQRQIVDSIVTGKAGIKAEAFWASGADLAGLLDDSGAINTEAVIGAADAAQKALGLARRPAPNPAQGTSANGAPDATAEDKWKAAFKR